ncbi:MAG TPA: S41 family peptidase [Verrucomicrobiae bacterium]|nr:S41 family peptidase [Verrucomicrobiae bacterium]
MKRRLVYVLIAVLLAGNLIVGARIYFRPAQAAEKDSAYPSLELFSYVLEKVRKDYVDGKNLTYQELVYGALKGMINTLDPHSEFMDPAKYDELQKDTQGAFGGLGIMIEIKDHYVTVLAPMDDTPGFKAGVMAGDRILKIDGKDVEQLGAQDAERLQESVQRLRGEPGTSVTVTFMRPSTGVVKEMKLTRAIIKVDMVKDINNKKDFPLGEDKIGYVRLVQFGEKTSDDLEKALRKLKAEGMEALIIDLRRNPGGLLDQAVEVCQKFLPNGKLIVSTEGQNPSQNSKRYAEGRGDELHGMPIVILVNGESASASEIVSGCLQDYHRAIILGERTFGKGSVQSILPLQDGSALRLTTAKYYTPSHKVIHGQGITPDDTVPMTDDEELAVVLKTRPGLDTLTPKQQEELRNAHDIQMDRAKDLLHGILIYAHRSGGSQKMAEKTGKEVAEYEK